MKHPLLCSLAALACLGLFSPPWTFAATKPNQRDKPNFSGTWTLDLKASTSLEPLLKQVGAGVLERKFAAWAELKATFHQTEDVLMVATRGLDEKSQIWASGSIRDLLQGIQPGPPPQSEDHQIVYQTWFITRRPKEITSTAELRAKVRDSFRDNGFEMFVAPRGTERASRDS